MKGMNQMKSCFEESGPEECRCFQLQWEMESRNLDSLGPSGARGWRGGCVCVWIDSGKGDGLVAGLRLSPEPEKPCPPWRPDGSSVDLDSMMSRVSSNSEFLGIFHSSWVAGSQQMSSREGTKVPRTSGERKSLLRSVTAAQPSCPSLSPSHIDLLSFL